MLQVGDPAPAFKLASDDAGVIDSAKLAGKRYVLYFYPKDSTSVCTRQACYFRDALPDFRKLKVPLFGVSPDDARAHAKFREKHALNFPLLVDPDKQLIEAYGVWAEKSLYGRKYMGVLRATFVIGADGRIEHVWPKVKTEGHAAEVLKALKGK